MSIVSSTFSIGHAQADGRKYVTETHIDNIGVAHSFEYLAGASADYAAIAAARAVQIQEQLAEAEFDALINDGT